MLRELCNQLCIRMSKYSHKGIGQVARWLAAKAGLKVVAADAVLLPKGFSMFDNALAKQVGADRAAMYQKIKGWQEYNCRKDKRSHFRQDRWWTYGRPEYWLENEFVWSSLTTVRRAFKDLEKAGLMIIDQAGGNYWLSAISGETVNLATAQTTLQLGLFEVDNGVPNRRSSIEKPSTLKQAKGKGQTTYRAPRKDAVVDFPIPETRNSVDDEMRESRDVDGDGHDELYGLPTALIEGWTDTKVSLNDLVAKYGAEQIKATWPKVQGFNQPIAGLRTVLKNTPSPRSAPPPSPAADDTEPDGLFEEVPGNETPAIDEPIREPELTPEQIRQAWLEAHVSPELLATMGGAF
jgi:hypothetical protein